MKLPQLMDADDYLILARGGILCVLALSLLVALAAAVGLAWLVFQWAAGGL
jgi:hypothetical protein